MQARVLVVEDDRSVRESVSLVLERDGFDVTSVDDGRRALDVHDDIQPDLIVLDVMLPGVSGLDVCRELRATSSVPIVMLTALTDAREVVTGLEIGADDYVTKPFVPSELAARVRAVLRRTRDLATLAAADIELSARDLVIDLAGCRVHRDGSEVELTATELRLLSELVRHAGTVLSREILLEHVWGYDYLGDSRLVDMGIMRLRDKLGEAPAPPAYIVTVRGMGYRFERA